MAPTHQVIALDRLPATALAPGVSRRTLDGEEATLLVYEFGPGAEAPPHEHNWEHLGYVVAGQIEIGLPDATVTVSAGGIYHIPSNVRHVGRSGPQGATLLEARRRPR